MITDMREVGPASAPASDATHTLTMPDEDIGESAVAQHVQTRGALGIRESGRMSRGVVPAPRRMPIRVAVVGDQVLTAQAVAAALKDEGWAPVAHELPRRVEDPKIVRRGWGRGIHAGVLLHERTDRPHAERVFRVLEALPRLPWLVLTGTDESPTWGALLAAGARGVLPVTVGLEDLRRAVSRMVADEPMHTPQQRARLIEEWEAWSQEHELVLMRLSQLTKREAEVLEALRRGATVAEVARAGGVSIDTVRSQVRSVLRKLDVPSQLAAVAALQRAIDLQGVARHP